MELNYSELSFKEYLNSDLYAKTVEEAYKRLEVFHISNKNGFIFATFLSDFADTEDIVENIQWMKAKGWRMFSAKASMADFYANNFKYLSTGLWTCRCENNFVKHNIETNCKLCNCSINESTKKIKYLVELFKTIKSKDLEL